MIELTSQKQKSLSCAYCGQGINQSQNLFFVGIHFLLDVKCNHCGQEYFQTLSVGHTIKNTVIINKLNHDHNYCKEESIWLAQPLIKSLTENDSVTIPITSIVRKHCDQVVILNCLDTCYGHVFWKLMNAFRHLQKKNLGLIVLIPASFEWLVPAGVAEKWLVQAKLSQLNKVIANLDDFIKTEMKRFKKVYISKCFTQINHENIDFKYFYSTNPFPLDEFERRPLSITYVLREDRFWLVNSLDWFFYKVCLKFQFLSTFRSYFNWKQRKLVKKTAKRLKSHFPEIKQNLVGLGRSGKFNKHFIDCREIEMNSEKEIKWCDLYANSQIVVGVHGSNMIIPTSLSAGFIELLPDYKIPHLTEDIALNRNARLTLFLGRHLPVSARPKLVSLHVINMIEKFPQVQNNLQAVQMPLD